MSKQFADNFFEIPMALAANDELRQAVIALIQSEPMPGKGLEDSSGSRLEAFRSILTDLANGEIKLVVACQQTEERLPRYTSPHRSNNRVFPSGWAERLVRTQFSRFYNQAVLAQLQEEGEEMCFVPHSDEQNPSSACTLHLAGRKHPVATLYARLINEYAKGNWSKEVKIPNHPHCTHVVSPAFWND